MLIDPRLFLAFLAIALVGGFVLGYAQAHAHEYTDRRMDAARRRSQQRQYRDLLLWIRANWPDEFEAHRRGVAEGYQQGVSHSPALDEEEAAA